MDEETRILINKIFDTLNDIRQQLADLSSPQSCGACNCGHCGCEDSDWYDEDEYDEDYDGNADDNYEMLPEDVLDHANQHLTSLM